MWPDTVLRSTELAFFGYRYRDTRDVSSRPDNTGQLAPRADVAVATFGASAVGTRPTARGEAEFLSWYAGSRATASTGGFFGYAVRPSGVPPGSARLRKAWQT